MKNAQLHTNVEPSALEQRDLTAYRLATQLLAHYVLAANGHAPSPAAIRQRLRENKLPHSLYPIGDRLHVIPVTRNFYPVGYRKPIDQLDVYRLRHLWLLESAIDQRFLILGSYFWCDETALQAKSPTDRKLFALRSHYALRKLGFPWPKGAHKAAGKILLAEFRAKGGAA